MSALFSDKEGFFVCITDLFIVTFLFIETEVMLAC